MHRYRAHQVDQTSLGGEGPRNFRGPLSSETSASRMVVPPISTALSMSLTPYISPIDCSDCTVSIRAIYGSIRSRLKEQGLHELPARRKR